jgi:hypothetical protein
VRLAQTLRRLDAAAARRRGTRRILVDSRTALNYEMVAPVVRALAADSRIDFSFTASEEPRRAGSIYRSAPPGARLIHPSRAALFRWDAYLTSDFMWATLPRGTVRIQMFHGVAGKYGFDAPTTSMRDWDRLFFVNERRLRNFIASGAIDPNSPTPRLIGMPKVDCLVDGSLRREAVLEEFGLDPTRPTVLYAPTWSPASSLNILGVPLIQRLLTLPVNVLVKLHDRSRDLRPQYSGGIDWTAAIGALVTPPNGMLALTANITPCLAAADVMISDHSSAAFEYLILDRPLVRIEVPELLRQANVHPEYVRLLTESSDTVRDVDGAIAAVERALTDPGHRTKARRRVATELFYRPGSASARCAAALCEVVELEPHPSIAPHTPETAPCALSA